MLSRIGCQLITFYQRWLRLFFVDSCRFWPSCSEYARQAIVKYGFFRGVIKGCCRIAHCHPFTKRPPCDPLL